MATSDPTIEELREEVESRERLLEEAVDHRRQVAWWADKPDGLHRRLVLEWLYRRVADAELAVVDARRRLEKVQS